MEEKKKYFAFIGTNSVRGSRGIYTLEIDAITGEEKVVSVTQVYNAGCVVLSEDQKNLYAASEGMTFAGKAAGGVNAFQINSNGGLVRLNGMPSSGQRTCCAALDRAKKNVYGCDFYAGTWNAWPLNEDGSLQKARLTVAPPPTGWQALHCIAVIDKDFLAVISLAETAVVIYRTKDGSRVTDFRFPDGSFPRYLAVSDNAIYAMLQGPDLIFVLENHLHDNGTLRHVQTISVMDEAHRTMPATSTIRVTPNQKLVLAANRPSNSITIYSRSADGRLTFENLVVVHGNGPRDFQISRDGRFVVVAMQHSDEVVVLQLDYERKTLIQLGQPVHVPSPAAVAVTNEV